MEATLRFTAAVLTLCLAISGTPLFAQGQDWSKVERLRIGDIVVVTGESGAAVRGRLLRADADSILLYAPTVDMRALGVIDEMIRREPLTLSRVDRVGVNLVDAGIRIGADGISKDGVPVAPFAAVFFVSSRAGVVTVTKPKDQRSAFWPTAKGAVVGGLAGLAYGLSVAADDTPCQPNCGHRAAFVFPAVFGGPFLGGAIGNQIGKPRSDLVIYRR